MLNKEDVLQSGSRCLVGEKAQDRRFCKHLSRERARGWSIRILRRTSRTRRSRGPLGKSPAQFSYHLCIVG